MEKEKNCSNCKHTNKSEDEFPCSVCVRNYIDKYEPITNYDRIKSMSVEEMVDFWVDMVDCDSCPVETYCKKPTFDSCKEKIKQWLLQEVSGDDR